MGISRSTISIAVAMFISGPAMAATETAQADANRKKPLQRCDQLSDKAQIECLQKARASIVDARKKRESAAAQAKTAPGKTVPEAKTAAGKSADAAEGAKK